MSRDMTFSSFRCLAYIHHQQGCSACFYSILHGFLIQLSRVNQENLKGIGRSALQDSLTRKLDLLGHRLPFLLQPSAQRAAFRAGKTKLEMIFLR